MPSSAVSTWNLCFESTDESLTVRVGVAPVILTDDPSASEADCDLRVLQAIPTDLIKSSDMNEVFAPVSTSARAGAPAIITSTMMPLWMAGAVTVAWDSRYAGGDRDAAGKLHAWATGSWVFLSES